MRKILITGANGFLGSNLTKRLSAMGYHTRILARPNSDLSEVEGHYHELALGDVTDKESLEKASQDREGIFHLAGVIAYDKRQRRLMEKVNVGGTQNIVDICLEKDIPRLLHLSSVVTVGASADGKNILTEDSLFNLHHLDLGYFETKKQAEEIVLAAARTQDLSAVCVNPATIYGPGDANKGSRKMQLKVAQGKLKYFTHGGVNVVHVEDVMDVCIKAFEAHISGQRYIVGSENITIKNLFERIAKLAHVSPPSIGLPNPLVHLVGKVGDQMNAWGMKGPLTSENAWTSTMYHWFSSQKAETEFKYKPRSAQMALEESLRWSQDHGLLS